MSHSASLLVLAEQPREATRRGDLAAAHAEDLGDGRKVTAAVDRVIRVDPVGAE